MKQTRRQALLEQFVQAGIKFCTAMIIFQLIMRFYFGLSVPLVVNIWVTGAFWCNSIFFGYWIRRGFDWHHHK